MEIVINDVNIDEYKVLFDRIAHLQGCAIVYEINGKSFIGLIDNVSVTSAKDGTHYSKINFFKPNVTLAIGEVILKGISEISTQYGDFPINVKVCEC